jgi:V/A-type H+-transporting ATPase subunit D
MPVSTNIRATRMELLARKRRLAMAKRIRDLLKDKRDELLRNFMDIVRKERRSREDFEKNLIEAYSMVDRARLLRSPEEIEELLSTDFRVEMEAETKKIAGVRIPKIKGEGRGSTPEPLDYWLIQASRKFHEVLPDLLEVIELDRSIELLSKEIEETRKRVNALEHVLIPHLEDEVKYIQTKLDEVERSHIASLMRIKDLIRGAPT